MAMSEQSLAWFMSVIWKKSGSREVELLLIMMVMTMVACHAQFFNFRN